jgi:Domain of unknown function (DUF5666)
MLTLNPNWRCLILGCVLLSACGGGGGDSASTSTTKQAYSDGQGASCSLSSASGIEGTGLRNKLTGRITGVTVSGANTTVAVGSTCSFTADGASVFQGNAIASISDLRVDQIITALGDFTDTQNAAAQSIYILQNGANGQLPIVGLGESGAPYGGRTWMLFDGSEYSVLPQAQVLVDGTSVSVTDWNPGEGEIVSLAGTDSFPESNNPGGLLATSDVKVTHMVDGPVDAIDLAHNQIVVLGQTVIGPNGINVPEGINVGDRVTISGHPTASGPIIATLVALSANTGDFLVSGVVQAANPAQHLLTLNGVAIDYGTAQLSGVPAGGPTNGERILVRTVRPANGEVLTATSIADDSKILGAGMGTVVAMHGIVNQVYSSTLVSVDGYPVKISDMALQTCGSPPPANSDVTLQGTIGADGTIFADIYCFTADPPVAVGSWQARQYSPVVQGTIQAIDPKYGTISILGLSAQPSPITRVMDSNGSLLSLGDLKVGDSIAVDGAFSFSVPGSIAALGILRIEGALQPTIQTSVLHVSAVDPILYVHAEGNNSNTYAHGWPINTDASTAYFGLTRTQFFNGGGYFPGSDIHCLPLLTVSVRINADGSLTALSITEAFKLDWCN